jgi:hypothetical protein
MTDDETPEQRMARQAIPVQNLNIWLAVGAFVGLFGLPLLTWYLVPLPPDWPKLLLTLIVAPIVGVVVGQRVILWLMS